MRMVNDTDTDTSATRGHLYDRRLIDGVYILLNNETARSGPRASLRLRLALLLSGARVLLGLALFGLDDLLVKGPAFH